MLIHQYTEFDVIGCHWIANSPPPPKKGGGGGWERGNHDYCIGMKVHVDL